MKRLTAPIAAWLLVELLPRTAAACAVCTAGRDDETNQAFLISTIFMSLLPLAALGTLVFVIWRRMRALEEETARRAADGAKVATDSPASASPILAPPSPAR